MENRERNKLYIVIGLAVVFVAVGYFRFFRGKITFFGPPAREATITAMTDVPSVDLKSIQPSGLPQIIAPAAPRADLRDIFAPAKKTARGATPENPAIASKPLPPLQLTGTIIGGKRPLAIINGRFLHQGESIEGFRVVDIARNQVTIVNAERKVVLNVLDGKEKGSGGDLRIK